MTSTLPPLVQAVSGAIGSASANVLIYPLDLVTTRVQLATPKKPHRSGWVVLHQLIRKYGAGALYDGIAADTGATFMSTFLYFYCYTFLRRSFPIGAKSQAKSPTGAMFKEVFLGFLAGVASRAITTPLSVIAFRLQTERQSEDDDIDRHTPQGLVTIIKNLYEKEGLSGFYRGFSSTILLALNPGITFALFQAFRRVLSVLQRRPSSRQATPSPIQAFTGAAISNAIASTLLYPLILSKTLSQSPSTPYSSLLGTLRSKRARSYQGLGTQLTKGCLSQGVTFLIKGRIEELIVKAYLRRFRAV